MGANKRTPPDWSRNHPKPYDILLAYFPYEEARNAPSADYHPVLVLSVNTKENPFLLFVSYGTSQDTDKLNSWDFLVPPLNNTIAKKSANLNYPTKFILTRTSILEYNRNWFCCPTKFPTPRLGCVDPSIRSIFKEKRKAAEIHLGYDLISKTTITNPSDINPSQPPIVDGSVLSK